MSRNLPIRDLREIIAKDLQLDQDDLILFSKEADELRQRLSEIIRYLLDHDFNRLLNLLYRIDVPEDKAKLAFADQNDKDLASGIADLIIERQLQKIETRKKYSR